MNQLSSEQAFRYQVLHTVLHSPESFLSTIPQLSQFTLTHALSVLEFPTPQEIAHKVTVWVCRSNESLAHLMSSHFLMQKLAN